MERDAIGIVQASTGDYMPVVFPGLRPIIVAKTVLLAAGVKPEGGQQVIAHVDDDLVFSDIAPHEEIGHVEHPAASCGPTESEVV